MSSILLVYSLDIESVNKNNYLKVCENCICFFSEKCLITLNFLFSGNSDSILIVKT